VVARGFGVAVRAGVGPGVVESRSADTAFLDTCASLPMMTEALALTALVCGSCRKVFCCFSVLSEDGEAMFEEDLGFLFIFQGDDAGRVFLIDAFVWSCEVSWVRC
jgi:hypothetical protein